MKITKPTEGIVSTASVRDALEQFLEQPEPGELAVCSGCKKTSLDGCSANCPDAGYALSVDPEQHPIERNVVSLVYELMATRLLETCWSCEGHMDNNNELWKLPQVCFYSSTPVYVKLLCQHLGKLYQHKKLTYRWHIAVADFSSSEELTYSLQPDLSHEKEPHLGLLQTDLNIIADGLHEKLKLLAEKKLSGMNYNL